MIKSMTGYGSAKGTVEGLEISVELKSVNNKFLDAAVRMPRRARSSLWCSSISAAAR